MIQPWFTLQEFSHAPYRYFLRGSFSARAPTWFLPPLQSEYGRTPGFDRSYDRAARQQSHAGRARLCHDRRGDCSEGAFMVAHERMGGEVRSFISHTIKRAD